MWQDREIRFDVPYTQLEMRTGELVIDRLNSIEDNKGNAGDQGKLLITNLRIIWHSFSYPRINLSIGYNTFVSMTIEFMNTVYGGKTQALHIMSSYRNCRYEFIFINLDLKCKRDYTSVLRVHRSYISSKLYREIKLRGAFIKEKRLSILPQENVHNTLNGVWNLSTEQGNVGTLIVTNVRIVWFADINYQYNVSIPYLVIASINIKKSKFGPTLVVMSGESSRRYVLGFKLDPLEKLYEIHKEVQALFVTYNKYPIFGVNYKPNNDASLESKVDIDDFNKAEEFAEDEISNVFGLYFSGDSDNNRKSVYNDYLGLAIEELKEGTTMQQLWELIPSTSTSMSS